MWRTYPAVMTGGYLLLACVASLLAQEVPTTTETVQVECSLAATAKWKQAVEWLRQADWTRGCDALDELERRHAEELVQISPRRFLNTRRAVRQLQWQLPRDVWSDRYADSSIDQLSEIGLLATTVKDAGGLPLIERRHSLAYADTAIETMVDWAWRLNAIDRAATFWAWLTPVTSTARQRIDPEAPFQVPTLAIPEADLLARNILFSLAEGDRRLATQQLDQLKQQHPEAMGTLAGHHGRLVTLVEESLAQFPVDSEALSRSSWQQNWSRRRSSLLHHSLHLGEQVWSTPAGHEPTEHESDGGNRVVPVIMPTVDGERVYLQSGSGLRALRDSDGRAVWPSGSPEDDGTFFEWGALAPPDLPVSGRAIWSPAVEDGRLLARTGSLVAIPGTSEPRELELQLVCLDVGDREGKLIWTVNPVDVLPSDRWRFSGPPLIVGDRALIAVRRSRPTLAVGVCCLDIHNGLRHWTQLVCELPGDPPETSHVMTNDMLTEGPLGSVVLAGDFGGVACLEVTTGRIEWVVSDDAPAKRIPSSQDESNARSASAESRHGVVWRDRVLTVQHDGRTVQQLDVVTGAERWKQTLPSDVGQIVGVRGGLVIVAGTSLWGLDAFTGEQRWTLDGEPLDGDGGPALIAGESVWWATGTTLYEVSLSDGKRLTTHSEIVKSPSSPRRLAVAEAHLLLVTDDELIVWKHSLPEVP